MNQGGLWTTLFQLAAGAGVLAGADDSDFVEDEESEDFAAGSLAVLLPPPRLSVR